MIQSTLGIDEAGRGPIIGPLVMCGIILNESEQKKLSSLGVKDSKLLTPEKREALYQKITSISTKYKIIVLDPATIDAALASSSLNLNWLEAMKSADIINTLPMDKVILDCPSQNIPSYTKYVKDRLNKDVRIVCEYKADLNHVIVAAASILAKVTRDREIEKIKETIGVDFGSGYTSDPKTREFLVEHTALGNGIFRKSWMTYKVLEGKKEQKTLGEY